MGMFVHGDKEQRVIESSYATEEDYDRAHRDRARERREEGKPDWFGLNDENND